MWRLTFMVFIASWACSMVSIASHSVACGRRSWLMICILSSEVLMEVIASIICYAIETQPSTNPNLFQGRPLSKVRGCQFDDEFGYLATVQTNQRGSQMTRGRRKDSTLPPSRPLTIQRAYRDRKAKYLADLEDRCRKAEEENERLRNELELARSESAASTINSELASKFRATSSGKKKTTTNFRAIFKTPRRLGCALTSCRIWSKRERC